MSAEQAGERNDPEPGAVLAAARHTLARTPDILDLLVGNLDVAGWQARPAAGRWSPLEILCHLRDEEREDFGARLRVVLAGGGVFAPIRPAEWVVERRYQDEDPAAALGEFRTRRAESLALLADVDPRSLHAVGYPEGRQFTLSGLDVVAAWAAHDLLHLRQLTGTLAQNWARSLPALRVDYAGDLPYPTQLADR